MKYIASLVLGLSAMATNPALAAGTESPVKHYEAAKVASHTEAIASLKANDAKVSEILKTNELDGTKMEAIHEISYSLESAVETLMKSDDITDKSAISALGETVENLHLASEKHEKENTQKWGKIVSEMIATLDTPQ